MVGQLARHNSKDDAEVDMQLLLEYVKSLNDVNIAEDLTVR